MTLPQKPPRGPISTNEGPLKKAPIKYHAAPKGSIVYAVMRNGGIWNLYSQPGDADRARKEVDRLNPRGHRAVVVTLLIR